MHRPGEPQVYPVCFQANVKSSGTLRPADTVKFPAAYNVNDDFKSFNLYWGDDFNKFTPPGPSVFDRRAASPVSPQPSAPPAFSTPPVLYVPLSQSASEAAASTPTAEPTATSVGSAPESTKPAGHCRTR